MQRVISLTTVRRYGTVRQVLFSPTSSITSFPSASARSVADLVWGRNLTLHMLTSWRTWVASRRFLWDLSRPASDATSTSSPCCSSSLDSSRRSSKWFLSAAMSTANCHRQTVNNRPNYNLIKGVTLYNASNYRTNIGPLTLVRCIIKCNSDKRGQSAGSSNLFFTHAVTHPNKHHSNKHHACFTVIILCIQWRQQVPHRICVFAPLPRKK